MPHLPTPVLITIYSIISLVVLTGAAGALVMLGKFLADESPEVYEDNH